MAGRLLCLLGKHRADGREDWDDGYYVSHCRHCRAELTRSHAGPWRPIARSLRRAR